MGLFPIDADFSTGPPLKGPDDIFISKSVNFTPMAVAVDNYTAYWIYFPDAKAFVPPFWGGVVLGLDHATYAIAQVRSPIAQSQAPTDTSYLVHTVWTDQPQPFNAGQAIYGFGGSLPLTEVHVIIDDQPIDVTVDNPFVPATSFNDSVKTTVVTLGTIAVAIPTTPLTGRYSLMIQAAPDNVYTAYIGGATVTGDETATGGIQLSAGMSVAVDADDQVIVYGICAAGQTAKVIVIEGK